MTKAVFLWYRRVIIARSVWLAGNIILAFISTLITQLTRLTGLAAQDLAHIYLMVEPSSIPGILGTACVIPSGAMAILLVN